MRIKGVSKAKEGQYSGLGRTELRRKRVGDGANEYGFGIGGLALGLERTGRKVLPSSIDKYVFNHFIFRILD